MDSEKTQKVTPTFFTDPPDWVIGAILVAILSSGLWLSFGLMDTLTDPGVVNSSLNTYIYHHIKRTELARQVIVCSEEVDTSSLETAVRETERAQILVEQEVYTQEAMLTFDKQYDDLDAQLVDIISAHTSKCADLKAALETNADNIRKARIEYNREALKFNHEYSRGWPERYLGLKPRALLREKEPIGPEFGPLYGTPASK